MRRRARRGKYGAIPIVIDGQKFASTTEGMRYKELALLQRVGKITQLETQVPFLMEVNDVKICKYIADFTYWADGKFIVEDRKGVRTATFNLKKKLMKAIHGIDILITYAGKKRR